MWIDLGFLVFIGYGFYLGYSRGILKTLYSILSIVIAILLCFKLSPFFIEFISNTLKLGATISFILGFILCFFGIIFIVRLAGRGVEKLFKAIKINFINKIAGGVMMSILFVISFSFIVGFLNQTKLLSEPQKLQSLMFERLEPIPLQAKGAIEQLKPAFKGFWDKSREAINESNNTIDPIHNENIEK